MEHVVIQQTDQAVKELSDSDQQMNKLIAVVGDITVPMRPDFFRSLVRSIIGQQISVQAASSIFRRLEELLENHIEPDAILAATDDELRSTGLSHRKINYLRDLAGKVNKKSIELDHMDAMDNNAIIHQLTSVKGIGKWTAEMFLIFSLGRMNVLAVDDIGIQRGAKWLYDVDKSERRQILLDKRPVWEPHLSIASFYLWEVVHLGFDKDYQSIDDIN